MTSSAKLSENPVLPDLRIVPLTSLLPHEEHDIQRSEPLLKRIQAAGDWLNPPVVASMGDNRFVILDGANRHFALQMLGYAYILVQVVEYESDQVELTTWYHVVSGITLTWFTFLRHIVGIKGLAVQRADLLHARAALARRAVLAYTVLNDGRAYTLDAKTSTLSERTAVLRQIVNTYKVRGVLNRISTDMLSQARQMYPDALAIVVFPRYEPAEIIVAARDGIRLPPGISRHIVYGRAMRLHYPLDEFRDNGDSLERKNERLHEWIQQRMADKRVRYYAEPTYMFDE